MNRRESLKTLGAISAGTILGGCANHPETVPAGSAATPTIDPTGRQDFEMARDKALAGQQYFDAHEKATIAALADIIIPKDDHSGSASEAGVPDFIEFIVKDEPQHQLPMRGG